MSLIPFAPFASWRHGKQVVEGKRTESITRRRVFRAARERGDRVCVRFESPASHDCAALRQSIVSRLLPSALDRYLAALPAMSLTPVAPFVDYDFGVCDGFGVRLTISHAAWQFRHFDNKALVVFAPVNDQLVAGVHETRSERTEMSSSTSSQWIPTPRPMRRQFARCLGVARRSRGNQANGAETRRPSTSVTISSSSVHLTSIASATGLLAKVLIPENDKLVAMLFNERVKLAQF